MPNPKDLDRANRVCISTVQLPYSMLRFFVFWDRNTDAARGDQREETGDTFRVSNNACGAKVSNALAS